MLLDNKYTIVPSIRFTLTYDNGIRKVITVKTRDTIDCSYKKNGEKFHIKGVVAKIGCNFNSSLGAVGTTAYLQVDGSSEYKGQVEYIQPSQVLDLTIISTTDITDNVVCSVDNEDQKITLIRENEVGVFQYSLDGITWLAANGAQGMSAYECAVKLGYIGTEEEWLASLKGEKGEPGEAGALEIYKVFKTIEEAENNRDLIPKGKLVAVLTQPNTILLVRNGTNKAGKCPCCTNDAPVTVKGYDYLGYLTVGPQGPKGDPGKDGKSAYQYAVEGGFPGTEEEFMDVLGRSAVAVTNFYMGPTNQTLYNTVIGPIDLRIFGYTNPTTFVSKTITRIDISSTMEETDQTLLFPEPIILRAVPTTKESAKPNIIIDGVKYVADAIMRKDGQIGVYRRIRYIESYNGETIIGDWMSSTGQLDYGAKVQYVSYGKFEPFSEIVQSQYRKLHTYDHNTKIDVTETTHMTVAYPINVTKYIRDYVEQYFTEKAPEIIKPMVEEEVRDKLAGKQDKLTAGTNITIDENNVISATGSGTGTITGIKMNGEIKGTSGVVDLGTVVTAHQSLADYYKKTETDAKVAEEATRATTAEGNLNTAITNESTRAINAENAIAGTVSAETTRATTAEGNLNIAITGEVTRATNAEATIANAVSAEETRAKAAETDLGTKKQDKLTAGKNITISTENVIAAKSADAIKYDTDGFTLYSEGSAISQTNKVKIKTINSQAMVGDGNIDVKTYSPFPSDFRTSGTLREVVDSMLDSVGAKEGMAYLGGIEGPCLPFDGNAECKVEFMTDNLCVLTVNSSNIRPYQWIYNSWSRDYKWKKYSNVVPNDASATSSNVLQNVTIDDVNYVIGSSTVDAPITVTKAVGGYAVGDVIPAGTSLLTVIKQILAPVAPPSTYKVYYGVSASVPTTLSGLSSQDTTEATLIANGFSTRYTANNELFVFAYPKTAGQLISIKDPNGFENIDGWEFSEITYDSKTFYLYRTKEQLTVTSYKMTFVFTD